MIPPAIPLETLLTLAVATAVASAIPGPTVAVVAANAIRHGARAGLATVLGAEIAVASMIAVVAVGLQAVVAFTGEAFELIKLAGAAYLIWIGWKMLTARPVEGLEPAPARRGAFLAQGFLVVWSNPKTLLFLGAFLPHFVSTEAPAAPQVLTLGAVVLLVATLNDGAYALMAGALRRRMTAARLALTQRFTGLAMIGGGVWLAFQRRA